MDYDDYAALEHVFTHTRDDVFKKQTLELEKLQRKFNRLTYSHQSLIECTCGPGGVPPTYCEGCGCWDQPGPGNETSCFWRRFYSELSSDDESEPRRRTWVLKKVFLCYDCTSQCFDRERILQSRSACRRFDGGDVLQVLLKLCTKYKLSYWLQDEDTDIPSGSVDDGFFGTDQFFHDDEDFLDVEGRRAQSNYHERKFEFFYSDNYLDVYGRDKMHHIAAYIIQRAFRCGWDYRRAFEEEDE